MARSPTPNTISSGSLWLNTHVVIMPREIHYVDLICLLVTMYKVELGRSSYFQFNVFGCLQKLSKDITPVADSKWDLGVSEVYSIY